MLKKILIAVVVVLVILAGIVAMQPSEYRVRRSATISAPPAEIFPLVNDFHKWDAWSPWAKLDPAMKTTYAGAPAGSGSVYTWAGNDKVGEGRMTITESNPSDLIRIRLEFLKPFAATNATDFTFRPEGAGTAVTWAMKGENNFVAKAFSLFMNMDKMIGDDFEKGLAQMKALAEAGAKK